MNGRVRNGILSISLAAIIVAFTGLPALAAAPTVLSATPPTGENTNANLTVTFTGTGMDTATTASLRKAGQPDILGTSFLSIGPTSSSAHFNLTSKAIGAWDVRVTNPDGTGVCSGCFIITSANPTLADPCCSPNNLGQGAAGRAVTITGSNFQNGATVAFSNTNVHATSTTFISSGQLDLLVDVSPSALTGAGNVTVTNPDAGSGSCVACFTVNAAPTIVSSSPSSAANTAPITLTLTGTNYEATGTAKLSKTGQTDIAGSNWTRNTANSLSIDFAITNAAPGPWVISIINADGGPASCSNCFTVTAATPTVTSTSPTGRPVNSTSDVSIIGTNFFPGAVASFSGTGITVNSTTFVDTTHVTANITIGGLAAQTPRDVTVTNTDGHAGTCTGCFHVLAEAPVVSGVSPTKGHQGTTIDVIVSGSHFQSGATVTFSGTGITNNTTTFNNSGQITVNISIDPAATVTSRDVTVTNPDTQADTCVGCFDVILPAPTATSASPTTGHRGTTIDVTITGTNFVSGAVASFSGTGITVNGATTFIDASHVKANITIDPAAGLSARDITVTNPDSQAATCSTCFTVILPAPTATSATPSTGERGTTIDVTVGGTNFVSGASVSFSGGNITVNTTTFTDSTHIKVNITIGSGAALTSRDVTVTNPDTQAATCPTCFTVTVVTTVTFTSPSTLTGPIVATFSQDVGGVTTSNFVFGVTGSGTTLAGTLVCQDVSSAVTSCAGSTVRSAWLTPTALLVPGQHYTATVNPAAAPTLITDSGGAPIPTSSSDFRGALVQEETSPAVSYAWRTITTTSALGGSYTTERLAGARAVYTFTGTSVTWYTVFGPNQGTAAVTIDGVSFGNVNNYRKTVLYLVARSFSGLSAGTHTLQITVNGVKGSSAGTGTFIAIDAMRPGTAALQRTPALQYRWRLAAYSGASGGHYSISDQKGASASFTFRGTALDWYAVLGSSNGKALIYMDGTYRSTVDLYRSATIIGRIHMTGLSDAIHTITIFNAGARNAASHGFFVTIDRFVVG